MGPSSIGNRRRYDNRARLLKSAQTRERIVAAGSELVHEFESWDWRGLTFRAVAQRAGVGERTVYRHFPTERHLHDAVMQRLEADANVSYDDVDLDNVGDVTARVFAALSRFSVRQHLDPTHDPALISSDERRRDALLRAVSGSTEGWSDTEQRVAAGLLDVLWRPDSYERLVGLWGLDGDQATRAIDWLMRKVVDAVRSDAPPPA